MTDDEVHPVEMTYVCIYMYVCIYACMCVKCTVDDEVHLAEMANVTVPNI
jgi:hypothetical protein